MTEDFFEYRIQSLKRKYNDFSHLQNYHVFTLLCMKYFFFGEIGMAFDPELALEYLTDGANDGGIDAIFNDPESEGNDVIIIQSKYYNSTDLVTENVAGELYKISETLKKLQNNKIAGFNEKLITAYRNATSQMEENGGIRIYFSHHINPRIRKNVIN